VGDAARGAATQESREGLLAVIYGALASAGLAIVAATGYATAEFTRFFRFDRIGFPAAASGFDMGFSLALIRAGHLVGLLLGLVISWGIAVPWLTAHPFPVPHNPFAATDIDNFANFIWAKQVRFIGAGAIAVASVWTLIKLIGPVVSGVVSTLSASRAA